MKTDGTTRRQFDAFQWDFCKWVPAYLDRLDKASSSVALSEFIGELTEWMSEAAGVVGPALRLMTQGEAEDFHALITRVLDKVEKIANADGCRLADLLDTLPKIDDLLIGLQLLRDGWLAPGDKFPALGSILSKHGDVFLLTYEGEGGSPAMQSRRRFSM
jgi:hypothetical protein